MSDLDRATQIVLEIIRLSGGSVSSKVKLFRTFYFAHLIYAKNRPDYLSNWPIVRMPHGPGIACFDEIVKTLESKQLLEVRDTHVGPYQANEYRSTSKSLSDLNPEQVEAIRKAVDFVQSHSPSDLGEIAHEFSHSWRDANDGEELNIYVDLLSEEEYARERSEVSKLESQLDAAWKEAV